MVNLHSPLPTTSVENVAAQAGFTYIHRLDCIFPDGQKRSFFFDLVVTDKLTFSEQEEWWAENIRRVREEFGVPIFLHSRPRTEFQRRVIKTWTTVPQILCPGGKIIDTLFN